MNYCIAYGENDTIIFDLSRSGNTYAVSTWDRIAHKTIHTSYFDSCTWACKEFFYECDKHSITPKKVEHKPSDFANIN